MNAFFGSTLFPWTQDFLSHLLPLSLLIQEEQQCSPPCWTDVRWLQVNWRGPRMFRPNRPACTSLYCLRVAWSKLPRMGVIVTTRSHLVTSPMPLKLSE